MKKFVLRLELEDNKEKRKALKTVSSLPGIDEISIDMKGKTLIVIGTVDPVSAASKLRKFWPTTILSVGPAKEPEPPKKEEPKKEEPKKEEAKKDEPKKEEEQKKEEPKKEEQPPKKEGEAAAAAAAKTEPPKNEEKKPEPQPQPQPMVMPYRPYYHPPPMQQQQAYRPYYPPMQQTYYHMHHSIEENPNACVIS